MISFNASQKHWDENVLISILQWRKLSLSELKKFAPALDNRVKIKAWAFNLQA